MKLSLKKGVTSQSFLVFVQDSASTTGTGKTGIAYNAPSFSCYYARPRATPVAVTLATQTVTGAFSSGGWVELDATNMPGWYRFDPPDAAFATGVESVGFHFKGASGMAPLPLEIELEDIDRRDTVRAGLTALPNVASGSAGAVITAGTGTAQLSVSSGNVAGSVASVVGAVGSVTGNVGGNVTGSVGSVVGAVGSVAAGGIARASFAADTGLQAVRSNTAQAGGATSITLDASASATTNFYSGCWVYLTGGAGAGQTRLVTAYNGTTKVATVHPAWATNPDNTSTFAVLAAAHTDGVYGDLTGNVTGNVGGNVVGDVLGGVMGNLGGFAVGALEQLFLTDSGRTYASAVAGSVVKEIADNASGGGSAPTALEIADAVWDELRSGHVINGSFGQGIASVQGDVTGSVASVAGAVGSVTGNVGGNVTGTVGSVVGNVGGIAGTTTTLDALQTALSSAHGAGSWATATGFSTHSATDVWAVGARTITGGTITTYTGDTPQTGDAYAVVNSGTSGNAALKTLIDTVDTVADAIRARTDLIPDSPAAVGSAMTLTVGERNAIADAWLDRADAIEVGLTPRGAFRLVTAANAGKLSGAATATITISNAVADSKNRLIATVDESGNRTAITYDLT